VSGIVSKRKIPFALARTADETPATVPKVYIIAENVNFPVEPQHIEQVNNVDAELLGSEHIGNDVSISFDGAECNAHSLGYLLWLHCGNGNYSRATDTHTFGAPSFDPEYFTGFRDVQADFFASTLRTQWASGSRLDNLSIEQANRAFAKISGSAMSVNSGGLATTLSPSIALTADDRPASWKALRAGECKIGYNGGARANDDDVTSIKFGFARELERAGYKRSSDVPDCIIPGGRTITCGWTRDFRGDAAAQAEYTAAVAGQEVSLEARWLIGANYVEIIIPHARVTASPLSEGGSGSSPMTVTVEATAYLSGSDDIVEIEVKDGVETDYASL